MKFKDELKINKYTNMIVNNSRDYKADLLELGIEV